MSSPGYTNEWNLGGDGSWTDTDPMGMEAEAIIFANPQFLIYFRKDVRFLCPKHYDLARQTKLEYQHYCPKCLGLGVKTTATIVPARINLDKAQLSIRETDARLEPGYIEYNTASIDFPRNVKPQNEDLVMAVEWNKPSQSVTQYPIARPIRLVNLWVIKSTNDHFERELAWYDCGVEKMNYNTDWANTVIPHLNNLTALAREVWSQSTYWG